jgi:HK97 family phage prohead protease
MGGWSEMIAPGAFSGALQATSDVLCLRDHNSSFLMGRTKSKTLSLTDSTDGLRYTCNLPKTSQAADLAESIDRGDLDATSFGFVTLDDQWAADESGNVLRTLTSVELHEVSPCSFPAYPASQVSLRTCPIEIRSKIEKRDSNDACECDCSQCVGGDCGICSNDDCEDPNCSDACKDSRSIRNADANRRLKIRIAFAA